jgi:hypothetical protein
MIERRVPSDRTPVDLPQRPEVRDRELQDIGAQFGRDSTAGNIYPETI